MRHLSRLVAAALVAAAAGLALPASPAAAAACPTDAGVTVVVDFNQLGGGVQQVCDAGGGDTAASLFTANGYPLTYAQRQPGFVCRVSGVPASDPCVNTSPTNAYWALYWSDGESGQWVYSSLGAASLNVPDGGYVGFSWKQGSAAAPPSASPTPHAAPPPPPTQAPEHTPSPDNSDGNGGNGNGGNGDGNQGGQSDGDPSSTPSTSVSDSTAPSATPSEQGGKGKGKNRKPDRTASPSASQTPDPSASPSVSPSDDDTDVAPTASAPDPDDDGLPGWVAPVLIVVLFAGATATVILRRRGAPGK